jgi:hypothetical protein
MTAVHHPTDFICPGCGADYKVVRVKAEADPPHRLIHCKVCKWSLAPTDKEYILKYFLISRLSPALARLLRERECAFGSVPSLAALASKI